MKKVSLVLLMICGVVFTSCDQDKKYNLPDGLFAVIETDKGDIVLQLEHEKTPVTVANFVALAEGDHPALEEELKDKPYYDGLKFHRVIESFMIQGGDPTGTGAGGPGYTFHDEIVTDLKHDKAGILSMANAGPGTNGSQFFITHKETPHLDGLHTVFGHVVEGQDVVNAIVQNDQIKKVTIIRNGSAAKNFDAPKVFKNALEEELKKSEQAKAQSERAIEENRLRLEEAKAQAKQIKNGVAIYVFERGTDEKPKAGEQVFIDYAGYFNDGRLFDTSIETVAEQFSAIDARRKSANQYQPIPFKYGEKTGLIPGFIEGIEQLNYGDKALVFIPPHLAYGERGAGNVIPPNTDLVFELHLVKK